MRRARPKFALDGDPRQKYVPRIGWAGNASEVLIQHENRLQNTNHVTLGDAASGATRRYSSTRTGPG